MKKYDPKLTAD
jgi:histone H3/H4